MELFLSRDTLDRAQTEVLFEGVDRLIVAVRAMPDLLAVANLDGAREMTAAMELMRGIQLLTECREHASARSLQELASRPIFECAARGRYLLVHTDGPDEFKRMCVDLVAREQAHATRIPDVIPAGLPAFLDGQIPEEAMKPLSLETIAKRLDRDVDHLTADAELSSTRAYAIFGAGISDSAIHAGLSAMKRFSVNEGGLLQLTPPRPLMTRNPAMLAAAWLGDLALDVAARFGADPAAIGERRPSAASICEPEHPVGALDVALAAIVTPPLHPGGIEHDDLVRHAVAARATSLHPPIVTNTRSGYRGRRAQTLR